MDTAVVDSIKDICHEMNIDFIVRRAPPPPRAPPAAAGPTFKATTIKKSAPDLDGFAKLLDNVRICLNKISAKNYDTQKNLVFEYFSVCENDRQRAAFAEYVINMATGNKFYSKIYSNLVQELAGKMDIAPQLAAAFRLLIKSFDNVQSVEPEKDYDRYCVINKENEQRRAATMFFIYLAGRTAAAPAEWIDELLEFLFGLLEEWSHLRERVADVDEIVENILIWKNAVAAGDTPSIPRFADEIRKFAAIRSSARAGLSTRAIFALQR